VSILRSEIDEYAEAHTTPHDELLERLSEETIATLENPQMLTGPVEGRLLELLVFGLGARRVLEIGTYSGYSALSMARGLPPDGRIDTCEIVERHADVARRYIAESRYADRIHVHVGPAAQTLTGLQGPWDFVFIDADKVGYSAYFDAVLPQLAPRGLIALDNTLQDGRVVDDPDPAESVRAIAELNDRLVRDPRVTVALLTVRDGVTLVRRND
jgi:caffeoyl-CoA O-methyltransferase